MLDANLKNRIRKLPLKSQLDLFGTLRSIFAEKVNQFLPEICYYPDESWIIQGSRVEWNQIIKYEGVLQGNYAEDIIGTPVRIEGLVWILVRASFGGKQTLVFDETKEVHEE